MSNQIKQVGDFGEQLVIFMLSKLFGYESLFVDHEGADIIAANPNNPQRFAISVKTRIFTPTESLQHDSMDLKQMVHLFQFAYDFNLVPAIAYVCIPPSLDFADIYIASVDTFNESISIKNSGLTRTFTTITNKRDEKKGKGTVTGYAPILRLSDAARNRKYLQHHDNILFARFAINTSNCEYVYNGVDEKVSLQKKLIGTTVQKTELDFLHALFYMVKETCDRNEIPKAEFVEQLWNDHNLPAIVHDTPDGNLSRQFGDFGEMLVMYVLGHMKGYRVAYIDYDGADLVAADKTGKQYAISVKSVHDHTYFFDHSDKSKLNLFAVKFGNMIPTIAVVFSEGSSIDLCILTLDELERTSNSYDGAISLGKKIDNKLLRQGQHQHINYLHFDINKQLIDGI